MKYLSDDSTFDSTLQLMLSPGLISLMLFVPFDTTIVLSLYVHVTLPPQVALIVTLYVTGTGVVDDGVVDDGVVDDGVVDDGVVDDGVVSDGGGVVSDGVVSDGGGVVSDGVVSDGGGVVSDGVV